jgi:hypothetical protein
MKIVIISPLFPPDIAPLAVYVKELAQRLSATDVITVLAYTHIPEKIPGVRILAIGKEAPLFVRLFRFFIALMRELRHADIAFIQNGPSVEAPMLLASLFSHTKFIVRIGDAVGLTNTLHHKRTTSILYALLKRASYTMYDPKISLPYSETSHMGKVETPTLRPEILPFQPYPTDAFDIYERSWKLHIEALKNIISHATRT